MIWALTIITVGMILLAFQAVAVKSNPNDLAPEYAGLLNGMANTAANNAGSLTALMAGFLFDTDSFIYIFVLTGNPRNDLKLRGLRRKTA